MLAPTPYTTAVWPIAGDVPDLQQIIADQAATMAAKAALIDAYQAALNTSQTPAPQVATATGSASGTALTLTAVTGTVALGATVTGTGIPPGTTIVNQQSGTTGGAGVYTTSAATTASSAALSFTYQSPAIAPGWPAGISSPAALMQIVEDQTAALRSQTMLLQQYQTLLNDSGTAPPSSGP